MRRLCRHGTIGLLLALVAAAQPADAQTWPTRPVRLICPFAPGGGSDMVARLLSRKISPELGQSVVVDYITGAGGMLGVEATARAKPDGYTVVLASAGPIAINPSLFAKIPYDPQKDLTAVSLTGDVLNWLVVHPSLPVHSVKDLIALAQRRPNQLFYGSSGVGTTDYMAGLLFNSLAKVRLEPVPYKGGAPALVDLLAGQVQLMFVTLSSSMAYVESNKLRPIAITGAKRFRLKPQIPTIAESGLPGYVATNWFALFAPAGTPKEAIAIMNAHVVKAFAAPDMQKSLLNIGIEPVASTPQQLTEYVASESRQWAAVVKEAKLKLDY